MASVQAPGTSSQGPVWSSGCSDKAARCSVGALCPSGWRGEQREHLPDLHNSRAGAGSCVLSQLRLSSVSSWAAPFFL